MDHKFGTGIRFRKDRRWVTFNFCTIQINRIINYLVGVRSVKPYLFVLNKVYCVQNFTSPQSDNKTGIIKYKKY